MAPDTRERKERRCGKCPGCRRDPKSPCREWLDHAIRKIAKEMKSEAFQKALFNNRHED